MTSLTDRELTADAANPVEIDGIELHVGGHRPERTDLVEALTTVWPSDRSRLGRQQRTDGIDFVPFHQRLA